MLRKKELKQVNTSDLFIGQTSSKKPFFAPQGYAHTMLLAPVGSGKGVCTVIPNLLLWQESLIIYDVKGENYHITSGYRASIGQDIFYFNPLHPSSHRYNPLDSIRKDSHLMVSDIQKMCHFLLEAEDSVGSEARNLLAGLIYLSIAADKATFGEIVKILTDSPATKIEKISKSLEDKTHAAGIASIKSYLTTDIESRVFVAEQALAALEIWRSPLIDDVTSASDFKISDFKAKKSTLYIVVEPTDVPILRPFLNFLYQHIFDVLARNNQDITSSEHGVLMIMDEFCSLKINNLIDVSHYLRGYKVKLLLTIYNIEQLRLTYGDLEASIIMANIPYKICFTANTYFTAQEISKLCVNKKGKTTFSTESIIALPSDEQLLLIEGQEPILLKKFQYYNDKSLMNKILPPSQLKIQKTPKKVPTDKTAKPRSKKTN